MKVTVLVSVYNEEQVIARAIQSILDQSYSDFEFLIIDDGSTDRTPEILRGYSDARIRVISHSENKGLSYSLREGVELAHGDYIARIDADDEALPDRFTRQVAYMDNVPAIGVLGTLYQSWDHRTNTTIISERDCSPAMLAWHLMFGNVLCHSSVMMRKEAVTQAGNYDPALEATQDYDLWVRIARDWEIGMVPEVLCKRYVSKGSITMSRMQVQDDTARHISIQQIHGVVRGMCDQENIDAIYDLVKRSRYFKVKDLKVFLTAIETLIRSFCRRYKGNISENKIRNAFSMMILDAIDPLCNSEQRRLIYLISFRVTIIGSLKAITRKCARKVIKNENTTFVLSKP